MATIYNSKRNQYKPYWTYIFLGICIAVYLYMIVRFRTTTNNFALLEAGAKFSPLIVIENEWWRLITSAFIHIGFTHLLFNGLSIYFIGAEVEYIMGHGRFCLMYLVSAIGGNLFSFAFNSDVISAGASTAIFGMYACYLALAYMNPKSNLLGARATTFSILLLINFLNSFGAQGIDNWGHFGGVVFGLLITLVIGKGDRDKISSSLRVGALIVLIILSVGLIYLGILNVNRLFN